jgi:lipopolysaccharide export system permease protein
MNVIRRYVALEMLRHVLLVLLALLALFTFFDTIGELRKLGRGNYHMGTLLLYVGLGLPGRLYQLMPIAVLLGTLLTLAQLSAHSEYTVLRTAGLSLRRLAALLLQVGVLFAAFTFVSGEYLAPYSERLAEQVRLKATQSVISGGGRTGLWVKDDTSFINVREMLPDNTLLGISIYTFDAEARLVRVQQADKAHYRDRNTWLLRQVNDTRFGDTVQHQRHPEQLWQSVLNPDMLSVLLVVPEQMSASSLWRYIEHLHANKQQTDRYAMALWSKLLYPLAVLVMVVIALPFAQVQRRGGGVGSRLFIGMLVGLGFHFLNKLFGHMGLLYGWHPLLANGLPIALFASTAMLVLHRQERR